jgi:hypothetical protein
MNTATEISHSVQPQINIGARMQCYVVLEASSILLQMSWCGGVHAGFGYNIEPIVFENS